jgi:hypothetical protein
LVAKHVTGTVQRQSRRLVHLQTERETLVVTPEHPFATADSRWVAAGELSSSDLVMSARFGAVRVLAVREEKLLRPVAVFNLSVEHTHAYLVGLSRTLVHNTNCKEGEDNIAKKTRELAEARRELAEAQRELESLQKTPHTPEQAEAVRKRIEEQEVRVRWLNKNLVQARYTQKKKLHPELVVRNSTDTEAIKKELLAKAVQDLETVKATQPSSARELLERQRRIAELEAEIKKLKIHAKSARNKKNRKLRTEPFEQPRAPGRDDFQRQLEEVTAELGELERQRAGSKRKDPSFAERESQLQKRIKELTVDLAKEDELRELQERLAANQRTEPSSEAHRAQLEAEKKNLETLIRKNKKAKTSRLATRIRAQDPVVAARNRESRRRFLKRQTGNPDYVNDTGRPRDRRELLEQELEDLEQLPDSPTRDVLIERATARLDALKRMDELRRLVRHVMRAISRARQKKNQLVRESKETTKVERRLAELDAELRRLRAGLLMERTLELLIARQENDAAGNETSPGPDEARLRAIEREIESSVLDDGRLSELERELGQTELIDEEFLNGIWHEAGEHRSEDGSDVDETLRLIEELLPRIPSPERTTELQSSLDRLRNELNEERDRFEANQFALINELAYIQATLAAPGTSQRGNSVARLQQIQHELVQLRVEWETRIQTRLDDVRGQLRDLRSQTRLRDEEIEAELGRAIAMLEHELQNPPF